MQRQSHSWCVAGLPDDVAQSIQLVTEMAEQETLWDVMQEASSNYALFHQWRAEQPNALGTPTPRQPTPSKRHQGSPWLSSPLKQGNRLQQPAPPLPMSPRLQEI